jgi:hypothetical protein
MSITKMYYVTLINVFAMFFDIDLVVFRQFPP